MSGREAESDLVLVRRDTLAEGVVRLTLAHPEGGPLPAWTPGAHLDLLLAPGLERQYSLCGDPADTSVLQVAVAREANGRGGSRYVHDRLAEGATVRVRGPRNHFALVEAPAYLFVAGGIGITPLRPMIDAVDRAGARWRLVYGGRTRASMAFADELAAHRPGQVELCPQDETGLLDLAALLGTPREDTALYACGPEPLLTAVEQRCASWPDGALHTERFAPKPEPTTECSGPFEVELARSGRVLEVPGDRSVLQTVEEAGVQVLSSCREGTCGTCETDVLEGVPLHRDSLLTAEERAAGDVMFICVSRCRPGGRLVLDL
ncbi:PDR/VanB family oxidoreductase [Streptomyces sp. 8L]|uniref:PDR/VanB family oxidoreductase n=1 Tax=Streptomyces sp. 8L TaxID=2877242 RepID=UPI001CD2E034|nr:PDR/VanB family oxidoreductase [Streptomyces sp. 8L]MCA1218723.1 PDR/VanB family oxidoreductase [Streptomyces sp. 8L]